MPVLIPSREGAIDFAVLLDRYILAIRHCASLCYRLCWSDCDDLRPSQSRISPSHVPELIGASAETKALHHALEAELERLDFVHPSGWPKRFRNAIEVVRILSCITPEYDAAQWIGEREEKGGARRFFYGDPTWGYISRLSLCHRVINESIEDSDGIEEEEAPPFLRQIATNAPPAETPRNGKTPSAEPALLDHPIPSDTGASCRPVPNAEAESIEPSMCVRVADRPGIPPDRNSPLIDLSRCKRAFIEAYSLGMETDYEFLFVYLTPDGRWLRVEPQSVSGDLEPLEFMRKSAWWIDKRDIVSWLLDRPWLLNDPDFLSPEIRSLFQEFDATREPSPIMGTAIEEPNGRAASPESAPADASDKAEPPAERLPDYVTLDQAAAAVHRTKRTLEYRKTEGKLPPPSVEGGGGKPDLWDWPIIRPSLEKEFGVKLPEAFPRIDAGRRANRN